MLLNPMPYKFVAVEAEPTHFGWIKQHFRDNGIDPEKQDLINKALTVDNKIENFWVGNPSGWYGQAIQQKKKGGVFADFQERTKLLLRRAGIVPQTRIETPQVISVPGTSLDTILKNYNYVDLIDIDVQGSELSILQHSIHQVNKKVKRIHIGTHSPEIEQGLRILFGEYSWECINDYKCGCICDTPYGKIDFGDGVQTWINPLFDR
jgi:FkbM family methyltransferase